jgi:hypothetical protein
VQRYFYDQLGNQSEEYIITIQLGGKVEEPQEEDDLTPPLNHCISTRWPNGNGVTSLF